MPRIFTAVAMALALVACGAGEVADTTTTSVSVATTTTATSVPSTSATTSLTTTTIAITTTLASQTTTSSGELPGDPITFGPASGDVLGVIGVAHDDVLNLRAAPGATEEILDGIPPLHDSLTALGAARQLPRSIWILVDYEGTDGWVNLSYVAYLGTSTDETDRARDAFGDEPSAGTMEALGREVVDALVTGDFQPDIVMSGAPSASNPGVVVFDMVGLADDSVSGGRLRITGKLEGGDYVLLGVESTPFCSRGLDAEGRCV